MGVEDGVHFKPIQLNESPELVGRLINFEDYNDYRIATTIISSAEFWDLGEPGMNGFVTEAGDQIDIGDDEIYIGVVATARQFDFIKNHVQIVQTARNKKGA